MSESQFLTQLRLSLFEEFWKWYPKKIGKLQAKAKWMAITNGGLETRTLDQDSGTFMPLTLQAKPSEIIEGAKRYRATQIDPKQCRSDDPSKTILKNEGKFTCLPVTWLNKGRWMDD